MHAAPRAFAHTRHRHGGSKAHQSSQHTLDEHYSPNFRVKPHRGILTVEHAAAPFQQRCIPGKGVGLIAAQTITAGSLLLHEDALVTFTTTAAEEWDVLSSAVKRLSEPQQAAYRGLANSFANQYPEVRIPSNIFPIQHA
jgi:hypothetical protein